MRCSMPSCVVPGGQEAEAGGAAGCKGARHTTLAERAPGRQAAQLGEPGTLKGLLRQERYQGGHPKRARQPGWAVPREEPWCSGPLAPRKRKTHTHNVKMTVMNNAAPPRLVAARERERRAAAQGAPAQAPCLVDSAA